MRITEKNSSIYALIFGIINCVWVYLMILIVDGKQAWTKSVSFEQWATITQISSFALIIIGILAIIFGIMGIIKALSGNKAWIIPAVIGILLATAPLIFGAVIGATWLRMIF
jgi:hypothetical protein